MELRLPSEYQEVEYIECDNTNGSSYILTDYIPTKEMTRLSMRYMRVKRPINAYLFSVDSNFCYAEIRYYTRWYVPINSLIGGHNVDTSFTKGTSLNEIFELSYLPDNLYINETVLPNRAYVGENSILPLILFARITDGTVEESHDGLRTYSFQIDKNGKLDLNLIPCYRKSDGEIGMYDTVSKTFYTNAGTGTFLKGADITRYIDNVSVIDTRRKIILNQPHIETASGDIVTFDTDMKGKLKECKVYFSPVQEGEGDPSPDNVRNIVGWNGVEGYGCGKNLFDPLKATNETRLNQYGELLANYQDVVSDYIKIQSSGIYTISNSGVLAFNERHCWYDKDKNFLKASDSNSAEIYTLTAPSDAEYIRLTVKKDCLDTAQFESGSEATSYEPYQDTTTSIDWTDSAGTIYVGYVDLVKGELVEEWHSITFDGENIKVNKDYTNREDTDTDYIKAYLVYFSPVGESTKDCKCDTLNITYYHKKTNIPQTPCLYLSNNGASFGGLILGKKEDYPELAEGTNQDRIDAVNNWFKENPTTVVYRLKNPIIHQLTPQQILTLKGTNNVYSNTNGQTEIKYWKH